MQKLVKRHHRSDYATVQNERPPSQSKRPHWEERGGKGPSLADSGRVAAASPLGGIASQTSNPKNPRLILAIKLLIVKVNSVNGRIDVSYGNNANAVIADKTLSLTPYQYGLAGPVDWRCGNGRDFGWQLLGTGMGGLVAAYLPTLIDSRYLPFACRP